MNINHHNYESILIDYLDGVLTEAECAEVDMFLQQNPEIADQISDIEEAVLPSDNSITYNKKDELQIISRSNADFEAWEQNFPKLPKADIIYPHKTKLYKFGKRQIPQWSWVAAAACFAVAVLIVRPVFENENGLSNVALNETKNSITANDNPFITAESIADKPIANITRRDVSHTPSTPMPRNAANLHTSQSAPARMSAPKNADNSKKGVFNTPQQSMSSQKLVESVQEITESTSPEYLAITALSPITGVDFSEDKTVIKKSEYIGFDEIIEDEISRRERLHAIADNLIVNPLKSSIHRISRVFYERKNDVDMFVEQSEFAQRTIEYFAQR